MKTLTRQLLTQIVFFFLVSLFATISAAAQDLSSSPTSLQFGTAYVGIPTGAKVLTITNISGGGITIESIGFDCAGFGISSGIAPFSFGATQNITHYSMYFEPLVAQDYNCNFQMHMSDSTVVDVPITGTGVVSTAGSTLNETAFNFSNQKLGSTSAGQTVTITNNGTSAVNLTGITLSPPSFTTNAIALPVTIAAQSTLPVTVYYTPSGVESEVGALDLTYGQVVDNGVSLTGNGIAPTTLVVSTSPTLPQATVNAAYQATLTAAGGSGSYTWALASGSTLPSGLTLSSSGVISGTVASSVLAQNYTFTVKATDTSNEATASALENLGVFANLADNCNDISFDVVGTATPMVALTDLGTGTYQGSEGGLYPNGSNVRPASHDADGVALAKAIVPLDSNGVYSPTGKYVMMAIGESTAQNEFNRFLPIAVADPATNPNLVIVNGAQGGGTPFEYEDTTSPYWATVMNNYLPQNGVTPQQVVVIWMEDTDGIASGTFPTDIAELQTEYENMMQTMHTLFPNLKMVYFSSRVYGGYSNGVGTPDNPEPYAYEVGFAVKWAIGDQINGNANLNYNPLLGAVVAPWMSWGPYYWSNGMLGRKDGLVWDCADFSADGTHPSTQYGQLKVATELMDYLKTDDTTTPWYLAQTSVLSPTSGNNQTGGVGTALPTALTVTATNQGVAAAGVSVNFADGSTGTFNPNPAITNASGIATTTYTLPTTAGTYTITGTATGYTPAAFTETATAAAELLTVTGGNNQSGGVSTTLPTPLTVEATSNGVATAGVSVTFSDGGHGTFNPSTAITNSSGVATTAYTLPSTAGTYTVTASSTGYTAAVFSETATSSANVLTVTGGNNQSGLGGTVLPTPLTIEATINGVATAFVSVTLSDGGAGGVFDPNPALTNPSGIASSTYTLPPAPGTYTVTATSAGYTGTTLTETAIVTGKAIVVTGGNNQTGSPGTTLPAPLTVQALNSGVPVAGVSISFNDGKKGTFTPNPAITNSSGVASTSLTLPVTAQTLTVTAGSTGYKSATLTETASTAALTLTATAGNNQTGGTGTILPTALTVEATSNGNPVSGVSVTFATTNGGSFGSATVTTGSNGMASTTYTLPATAGTVTITASATSYTSATFTETATASEVLTVNGGNNQTGAPSTTLPTPLTVLATNNGVPVAGASVSFIDGKKGSFSPNPAITNSSGIASTNFTLPATNQTVTVTAGVLGYTSATFTETAGTVLALSSTGGNNQSGAPGTTLPVILTARALSNGNPVSGVSVTFSGTGTFSTPTSTTNSDGLVSSFYTLPTTAGTYTVTASATNYTAATFTETATSVLALTATGGNNQSGAPGSTLPTILTVRAMNNGNPVSGVSVTFSGTGTFSTPTTTTNSEGLASSFYTLPTTAGTYTLTASATNYTAATFTETATNVLALTATGGNNQSGATGTTLPVILTARAMNNGSPVSGVSVTFSGTGTFSTPTSTTNSDGLVSSFYTLPTTAGTYTLTASATNYTAATFTETATASAQTLAVSGGNNQTAAAGSALPTALTTLATVNGTPTAGVSVGFSDGAGGTFSPNPAVTNSSGIASTTYTLPATAGTYTVTASTTGYTSATFTETGTTSVAVASLGLVSGGKQTGTVGTTLPVPLVFKAENSLGAIVVGASVSFTDGVGGTFSPNPAITSSTGQATTTYTLPTVAEALTVTASAGTATTTASEKSVAGAATKIAIVSGNNQSVQPSTQLPNFLVVSVTDQYGNGIPGYTVTFTDNSAGGSFSTTTPVTNSFGQAEVSYMSGTTAGTVTITASTGTVGSVNFTVTVL
jgi:hypothetical protein